MFQTISLTQRELDLDALPNSNYALIENATGLVRDIIQIKHISLLPALPAPLADGSTQEAIAAYNLDYMLTMKYRYTPPEGFSMVWCDDQPVFPGSTKYIDGRFVNEAADATA